MPATQDAVHLQCQPLKTLSTYNPDSPKSLPAPPPHLKNMDELTFGIAGKVLVQLASLTYHEVSLLWGVRSDLIKLERTMSSIKAVLLDAEEKQASDHRLRTWLDQLKDVLNDVEDALDEFQYRALQKEVMKTHGSASEKVRHFFSGSNPLPFHLKLGSKIKDIRERLDEIAADKEQFNLTKRLEDGHIMHGRRKMTHSFVHPSNVIGRDDDKEKIIHLLMHPDASRNVNIIPIIGIGGLGKTTLAKLVYNDERVVIHFQLRNWVCVSEDFNVSRLIKEILKSAKVTIDENLGIDQWQTSLRELLKDKKFLLVLDDVWNEDRNKWIELKDLLMGGCNGSTIIVTTRISSVASIMGTVPTYNLDGLSREDCLSLFVKLAFKEGEEKQYPNLLEIGNKIVEKCKGVPLAVKTLGSLLYLKIDEREWKNVRDNEIWRLEQKEGDILPALRLSYDQLPFHLKQCFAYCSLFPKNYVFDSALLIQFWMAHGLLQSPINGNKDLKNVGELYIKELWSRSFFQDVGQGVHFLWSRSFFQDVGQDIFFDYFFKMHDLVHDLAFSVAQGECSTVEKKSDITERVRHLSFLDSDQEVPRQLEKLGRVRTIIFQIDPPISLIEACILRFIKLRVLDLSNSSLEVLSTSIGTLKHLRYLSLSGSINLKKLPNSICKLYNLQTLLLDDCENLEKLPEDTRNMFNLSHLTVTTSHTCLLKNGLGCFNSLRHLSIVRCFRLKCLFERMDGCLANLQTLNVLSCPSLTSLSLNIKHLTALESLIIRNCKVLSLEKIEDNQGLKLSLRRLVLKDLQMLVVLPQWLQGSANTLQILQIEKCHNLKELSEWLPSLKSLQTLQIINCPSLYSLPEGMQCLTALRELKIKSCPGLNQTCRQKEYWPKNVPHIDIDQQIRYLLVDELSRKQFI